MTRKRTDKRAKPAVPEEILAEGSGPNEVVEADAQALADAAASQGLHSKRGRKAKQAVDAWGQPVEPVDTDIADVAADEGDVVVETSETSETSETNETNAASAEATSDATPVAKGRTKRGRKAKGRVPEDETSVDVGEERTADAAIEPSDSLTAGAADDTDGPDDADGAEGAEDADDASGEGDEPSEEARSEQSLEDAVMRAEAEADLGSNDAAAGQDAEGAGGEAGEPGDDPDVAGAALPTTAASMDDARLKNLVEALVFASDKPVTMQRLRQLTRVSEVKRLEQALAEIAADYTNRGIALQHVSGGYQFRTNTTYSVWVQQLIAGRPVRLSRAQLETLAIVAYRQPITRPEVDEIRGVDSSATLRLLLDRSLIRVLGKREDVGRPMLYGTTKEFLDFFSLQDLRELPTLREYSELTAESRKVMSDRLGLDADGNAVDENGSPIDADGNPLDDGTDVLPDAPVDSMDASATDPGAEDDAAIEAVSAVTGVIGIEEERIDTTLPAEDTSSDEHVATSSDEQSATSSEHVEASSDEHGAASSDEHGAASSGDDHVAASSDEHGAASSGDDHVAASSDEHGATSSEHSAASSDEHVGASSGDDHVALRDEHHVASSDDHVASSDDHVASSDDHVASSDDRVASSDDRVASSDDQIPSTSSDNDVLAHDAAHDNDVRVASHDAHDNDVRAASHDAAYDNDEPQGMPRGASQEDVIATTDEPVVDEVLAASHDAVHDNDEPHEAGVSDEAPSSELMDASAPDRLDETDKSPAE